MWVFFAVLGVMVVGGIVAAMMHQQDLNSFQKLGVVTGKTPEEICAIVGQPSSVTNIGPDQVLYQWIKTSSAGGYHYALQFDNGKCIGFTHQHVS